MLMDILSIIQGLQKVENYVCRGHILLEDISKDKNVGS